MHRPWKDNKPGWQQRLETDLDALGLREAERRLATDFYDMAQRGYVADWIERKRNSEKLCRTR